MKEVRKHRRRGSRADQSLCFEGLDRCLADPLDLAAGGWLAGVRAGFNAQAGVLVFGAEADLAKTWIAGNGSATDGLNSLDYSYDLDATLSTVYLLGNLWFDLDTGSALTPYIGGGVGIGWASIDYDGDSDPWSGSGFAYQVGVGIKYAVTDSMSLDLGYRYMRLGNANSGRAVCDDGFACVGATPLRVKTLESHEVTLGVRWDLGAL